MAYGLVSAASIAASVLFILSLGGLSGQESAKRAIWYGIIGMAVAVLFIMFGPGVGHYWLLIPMMAIGAAIGAVVAKRVEMTEMPQLVAALHSFVGLTTMFIGFNADIERLRVLTAKAAGETGEAFAGFATTGNSLILPANLADLGGLIATAMTVVKSQKPQDGQRRQNSVGTRSAGVPQTPQNRCVRAHSAIW